MALFALSLPASLFVLLFRVPVLPAGSSGNRCVDKAALGLMIEEAAFFANN
ncbi:hypothetical protein [Paenibacillus sp. S150]|uniref:hypothetical protein n=1 Tax=Paenibacillus sp. S150 TaxID=2749826 RepID=UPI001C571680|nr:hypothetical protein [Paenibacillus sp. S150]MBW4085677.1 hypothetical protein [Paenibacillus sp. S150]